MIATAKTGVVERLAIALLLIMTADVCAQDGEADSAAGLPMLMEPIDLEKRLNEPNLRVLDARSANKYLAGHIPGAVRVDLDTWRKLATAEGGLHDADAWSEQMGQLGVHRDSQVVVCGEALPDTARVWWLLKYAGVSEVAILNGGWQSWSKEGRRQEKSVPEITRTDFRPNFQADRLEEIDALKASLQTPNVKLVDTRSDGEYTGETVRGKRGGRIPGAVHLDWIRLVAPDGRFKTTSELRDLFRESNILPTDTAVCY